MRIKANRYKYRFFKFKLIQQRYVLNSLTIKKYKLIIVIKHE